MDWRELPVRFVPVAALVWPDHDIHADELVSPHPRDGEPVCVEALRADPGRFFIHDGRHRVLRAIGRGDAMVAAHVFE